MMALRWKTLETKRRAKGEGSITFDKQNNLYCARYKGKRMYGKTKAIAREKLEQMKLAEQEGIANLSKMSTAIDE